MKILKIAGEAFGLLSVLIICAILGLCLVIFVVKLVKFAWYL